MKPSLQIREIAKKINKDPNANDLQYVIVEIQAILDYLDEEYERNKPCEHEETESWNDYIICKKCKIMW